MGRRLVILFLMLATAVTTSAVAVGVSQDFVANCDDGHTWEDSYVVKEASCLKDGILLQECSVCGEKQEVAISALGHDMALIPGSALEPNCTENGAEASKKCTREGCEFTIEGDVIDALGHEYGAFTSNGNGTHSKVCANDDSHVVTENCAGGNATCTAKAICSVCDEAYGEFAAHVYNQEVANADTIATEATCTAKATYFKSCVCGEKGTETFESGEKLAHVYAIETISAETLKTPADCSHDAVYYLSCECGAYGDDAYTFVAVGTMGDHNFLNTTVKDATTLVSEATCTEHAIYKYTCTGCDAIGTETYEGEILDHVMTHHDAVVATCQAGGNVEYWACSTCSKNYDAEQGGTVIEDVNTAIDANNHVSVETTKEVQDSTCTEAGWTKEEKCTACGVLVTESEAVEAKGHVGSTTEVNGCANCDHVFTVAEIVEMAKALASGKSLTGKFELTGVISKITYPAGASNISVDMVVENGDNDFTINCYKLNGNGFSVLAVGDTITVQGLIKNFNGTIEFDGTTATNCVLVSSLHSVTVENTENGSVSVNVNEQVAIGTEVIVTVTPDAGYKVISVTANGSTLVAVEGVYKFNVEKATVVKAVFVEEGSSVVLPSSATLTFDANKENRTEFNKDKQVWQQNGVTLTNNKGSSTSNIGDYAGRFYKNSDVIISFTQKMVKIVIDATGINADYVDPYADSITNYTVTIEGGIVTIDLGEGVESITFKTTAQLRANSITVYYFEESQEEVCTHDDTEITKTAKDATCTEAGWTEEISCVSCGEVVTASTPIDALGHEYGELIEKVDATCASTGKDAHYFCDVCDTYFDAEKNATTEEALTIAINAENHSGIVTLDAKAATCTETGLTEGKYCEDCETTVEAQDTVDALGHSMTYHAAVEANCQADGNVEYWACSVCEKNYNAEENGEVIENVTVVDKDNHTDLITLDAVAATCTETGLTEGQKCNACGVTTIKQDIAPALNHLDENSDNVCDREDCLAIMCDGSHLWEDKKDADKHWEECSACHEIQNVATHTYENPEYRVVDGALKLVSTCVCDAEKVEDVEEEVVEVSNAKDLATVLGGGFDVVLTENVAVTDGAIEITKSATLDLGGKDLTVSGFNADVCEAFYIKGAGVEVTIKGEGNVIVNDTYTPDVCICVISATDGAKVTIEGGNFVSYGDTNVFATTGAIIDIKGGRFEAKERYEGVNYLIDIDETIARENWGKINVYGGEFVGFNPANHTNDGAEYTNKVAEGYHSILVGDAYVVSAHNHSSEETAPTCTTAGFTTYTCVCGDTYEVAGADALGHEYGELVEKVDATCVSTGKDAHYFCDVCDTYFDAEKNATTEEALTIAINAENHSGIVTLDAKAATCTETGLTEGKYCEDCETTITAQDTVDALGHSMTYHAAVDATCATAGNVEYWACANCSKNFDAEEDGEEIANVTIAALGHKYVNGECSVCHAIKEEKTLTLKHNKTTTTNMNGGTNEANDFFGLNESEWTITAGKGSANNMVGINSAGDFRLYGHASGGNTLTIKSTAYTIKTISLTFTGSSYSNVKVLVNGVAVTAKNGVYTINASEFVLGNANSDTTQVRIKTVSITYGTECDHVGTLSEKVVAPTCTEDGYTQYTCSKCAHTWKIAGESALGHEYGELVEKVDATCVSTGMGAHYFCDVCDTYFDAEKNETTEVALTIAIDEDNHVNTQVFKGYDAECKENGLTDGEKCLDCGETIVPQEEIPMLGCKDENSDNACDVCGESMCEHEDMTSVVTAPTCTTAGYTTNTCDCGYEYVSDEVDALGHTAGEVVVENKKDATCTTDGSYDNVVYCTVDTCKAELSRETITINATGHSETEFTYAVNAKDATKHDKKCADCGAVVATEDHVDSDSNKVCDLCESEIKAAEPVTVTMTTFTAISGNLGDGAQYSCAKGGGTTAPVINSNVIRIYQNNSGTGGGTITISAKEGYKIQSVTIGSDMATKIAYTIDSSTTKSTTTSLEKGGKYTYNASEVDSITFICMGNSSSTRLYVNYLSVTFVKAQFRNINQQQRHSQECLLFWESWLGTWN